MPCGLAGAQAAPLAVLYCNHCGRRRPSRLWLVEPCQLHSLLLHLHAAAAQTGLAAALAALLTHCLTWPKTLEVNLCRMVSSRLATKPLRLLNECPVRPNPSLQRHDWQGEGEPGARR